MEVSFRSGVDGNFAEHLVRTTMQPYYEEHGLVWDPARFERSWQSFDNFELLYGPDRIGLMSLEYDQQACYIRDLHLLSGYRGRGLGTRAVGKAAEFACEHGVGRLRLKVFRSNPATRLYRRCGFETVREDNRFYWMECRLLSSLPLPCPRDTA